MVKAVIHNFWVALLVFVITSCVTINIYFPAAAVEKAADRIVDEVWGEPGKEPGSEQQRKPQGKPESRLYDGLRITMSMFGTREASAQQADINVSTPAIRALKDAIQKRADEIKPFMDSGNVGISNDGLLELRSSSGLNLRDKAQLNRLIEAENSDRNSLYAEIAKANNFSPDKVSDIRKIFAGSWMKNARDGWWIQDPDGTWRKK